MIIVSNSSFTEDQHAGTSLDCAFADEDKGSKDGDGGAGHQQALTGSRISIPGFFGTGFSNTFDPGI